jgi:hypothetical protein
LALQGKLNQLAAPAVVGPDGLFQLTEVEYGVGKGILNHPPPKKIAIRSTSQKSALAWKLGTVP